jgi:nitroreductase
MMKRREVGASVVASTTLAAIPGANAASRQAKALPPAGQEGGMALTNALKLRRSTREYATRAITEQLLSDLLWAAFGVNRTNGDRTAPYWRHIMVIDIYIAMADGVWSYDPQHHCLISYLPQDLRALTGTQDFVGTAPLNLIYVAHGERMTDVPPADRRLYASVDTGFIGQNVYLFCASRGLGTVFRGAVPYEKLEAVLGLPRGQFVTFAQTVGYPA